MESETCVLSSRCRMHMAVHTRGHNCVETGYSGPKRLADESCFRYAWIAATTTDPSPTLDATRLTEPERTSPTAKIPGTEVL
jgi:hypothetical protein